MVDIWLGTGFLCQKNHVVFTQFVFRDLKYIQYVKTISKNPTICQNMFDKRQTISAYQNSAFLEENNNINLKWKFYLFIRET